MNLKSTKTRWVAVGATVAALGGGGAALAANGADDGSQDLKPGASSVTVPTGPGSSEPQDATEANETPGKEGAEGREDPKLEAKDDAAETAEAAQLAKVAKVTEAQAKLAAITRVPGTATAAELGNENGNVVWEVEVKDGSGKVQEVKIDAGNAQVLLVGADD